MYAQSVTIGPEFFVKSFNDYRDKFWAFAREILQNSIDCGSKSIKVQVIEVPDDDQTLVIVENDGAAMTREILLGKLLSLGSSGKDFQDAVGGFGKAKEILYFAHQSYTINSGICRVAGSGAGYDIDDRNTHLHGTRSAVTWKGLVGERLRSKFRRFISLCDRRGVEFTLDGEAVTPEIPRFRCLRPLVNTEGGAGIEWAHPGVHPTFEAGLMVVRIGGIPMFTKTTSCKQTIVLELPGTSGERLTANRDGRRHPYSTRLRDLITQMTVDRRSALKKEVPVYTRYGGPKLKHTGETREKPVGDVPGGAVPVTGPVPDAGGGSCASPRGGSRRPPACCRSSSSPRTAWAARSRGSSTRWT